MKLLTPPQLVAELNALGCGITAEVYRAFCLALASVRHQGTEDRRPEPDSQGRLVLPLDPATGKVLQIDRPYDAAEVDRQRLLHSSVERHLNMCRCANRWVF